MGLSLILPMSAFALVASISPGPVNIMGLNSGAHYPLSKGLIFITGATLDFVILFLAIGYGLRALLVTFPDFAALYLPICWLLLSCWVYAGVFLRQGVQKPKTLCIINRVLAVLLAGSCLFLLLG